MVSRGESLSRSRFLQAWRAAGVARSSGDLYDDLLERYSEPQRAYHTLQHIEEILELCDRVVDESPLDRAQRARLELAIWFHDAVYDPRASDNEERSADLATEALTSGGAEQTVVKDVEAMILVTKQHRDAEGATQRWLVDLDLAVLGAPPERFAEYERQIRFEYSWVPDAQYVEARRAVLEGFLERERLYVNEVMRRRFDEPARANLRKALEGLAFE